MNSDIRPAPYSLRIDPAIRARLEAFAKAGNRSLHAEIMMRLEATLEESKFGLSENISGLGGGEGLSEAQRAEVLALIRRELGKVDG
jgi:hypothetical protein